MPWGTVMHRERPAQTGQSRQEDQLHWALLSHADREDARSYRRDAGGPGAGDALRRPRIGPGHEDVVPALGARPGRGLPGRRGVPLPGAEDAVATWSPADSRPTGCTWTTAASRRSTPECWP